MVTQDLAHTEHLVKFFQVPQSKRRRRLLYILIPGLLVVAVAGALVGFWEALCEVCGDWKEAWDLLDPRKS